MHELSIATSLVERACEKAAELGGVRVAAIRLRLGALSGVAKDALLFSFDVAARGTRAEGARLEIAEVPTAIRCGPCGAERDLPDARLLCPVCGEPSFDVVRGRELEFTSMEVEDVVEAPDR